MDITAQAAPPARAPFLQPGNLPHRIKLNPGTSRDRPTGAGIASRARSTVSKP